MLHVVLIILIVVIVFVAIVAMVVMRMMFRGFDRLRDMARKAMGYDDSGYDNDNTGRRSRQYTYTNRRGRSASAGGASSSARSGRRQQSDEGTIIIDSRDPELVNRKIFSRDEGEYVDFEEEK